MVIAGTVIAGCNHGTRPANLPVAQGPEGVRVAVRVRGETIDRVGELYAVDSAGVILRDLRLVRIRWTELAALDVAKFGADYDLNYGQRATSSVRQRLAMLSRFPQGLNGDLLRRVLVMVRQDSLDVVPVRSPRGGTP
jgi:hypothetical protein